MALSSNSPMSSPILACVLEIDALGAAVHAILTNAQRTLFVFRASVSVALCVGKFCASLKEQFIAKLLR